MKISRTASRKIKFDKISWGNYCHLVRIIRHLVEMYCSKASETDPVEERIMGLILQRLEHKMARKEFYPLQENCYPKARVSITLEAEEALTLWHLYPELSADPVRSAMNLDLPRFF